jgi:UDP-N-acetylmuramoylalanine--D-glutamate ligase
MIAVRSFENSDVGVFGLARSGMASVRALVAGGARVYGWDDQEEARRLAAAQGAVVAPWTEWPWSKLKALVLSPGVPLTHPAPHGVVLKAKASGVEVIGDIELFAREIGADAQFPGRSAVIAITGTNGKSTTTALVGHILSACGFVVQVGGNIGKAVLELEPPGAKSIYVLELSSYQIELCPGLVPDVAVLSNITPDHLDRHATLDNYAGVKARLLSQASKAGQIVIGVDDPYSAAIFTRHASNGGPPAIAVSVGKVLGRGVFVVDGILYDAQGQRATKVMDLSAAAHLSGAHNHQNAALAFAATKAFSQDARMVADAIVSFPGLAHRMEDVGRIGKIRFVNDSKATNADAAGRALACFADIYWIAGGKAKQGGIKSLAAYFPRIRKAYLIGDAAPEFAAVLDGNVPLEMSRTLDAAVQSAARDAEIANVAAPVVLLSPAGASFDQFKDYEQRGDVFRELVAKLRARPTREAS